MSAILGLDLGVKTGWAFGTATDQLTESGVQDFTLKRGESAGLRYLLFRKWLSELLSTCYPFPLVVYESPHHRGGHATEIAYGLATRVQELCAARDLLYAAVHSASLKKFATGSGRADKLAMRAAAASYFPTVTAVDDNQVDACLLVAYAQANLAPGLLYGPHVCPPEETAVRPE
jgi:hypothetical protein